MNKGVQVIKMLQTPMPVSIQVKVTKPACIDKNYVMDEAEKIKPHVLHEHKLWQL